MQLTYRFRLKDKHDSELRRQARAVNFVWNFCGETQRNLDPLFVGAIPLGAVYGGGERSQIPRDMQPANTTAPQWDDVVHVVLNSSLQGQGAGLRIDGCQVIERYPSGRSSLDILFAPLGASTIAVLVGVIVGQSNGLGALWIAVTPRLIQSIDLFLVGRIVGSIRRLDSILALLSGFGVGYACALNTSAVGRDSIGQMAVATCNAGVVSRSARHHCMSAKRTRLHRPILTGIRRWTCSCGAEHDRDVNAAQNIARRGLATLAEGALA